MIIDQLIFVGFNGKAMALDRDTGEIVWTYNQMKGGNVTFLLDGDRLIASTNGYIYCLDPLTGQLLWHNPMKGCGWASHRWPLFADPASSRGATGGASRAVGPFRGNFRYDNFMNG